MKHPVPKFPRTTLEEALRIARAIKDKNGGNPWDSAEVAKAVGLAPKANAFFYLAAASREYGLTVGSRDTVTIELAPLGREIVYAPDLQTERMKLMDAFLKVEVFKSVLDYYKGSDLPEMQYLANTLESKFRLPPASHEAFSHLFRENCAFLGIKSGFSQDGKDRDTTGSAKVETAREADRTTVTLAEPQGGSGPVAFVIMPFQERDRDAHSEGFFQEALRSLITIAARDAGFTVRTANRQGSDVIQSTIMNALLDADLVIADLTEHNPNVLFELGVRMAEGKPTALIKASGTGRIFDVDNVLRVFEYNANLWPTTVRDDLPKLTDHIRATWQNRETDQAYMKILRGGRE